MKHSLADYLNVIYGHMCRMAEILLKGVISIYLNDLSKLNNDINIIHSNC